MEYIEKIEKMILELIKRISKIKLEELNRLEKLKLEEIEHLEQIKLSEMERLKKIKFAKNERFSDSDMKFLGIENIENQNYFKKLYMLIDLESFGEEEINNLERIKQNEINRLEKIKNEEIEKHKNLLIKEIEYHKNLAKDEIERLKNIEQEELKNLKIIKENKGNKSIQKINKEIIDFDINKLLKSKIGCLLSKNASGYNNITNIKVIIEENNSEINNENNQTPIVIEYSLKDKISQLIEKYDEKTGNNSHNKKFFFGNKELSSDLTLEEEHLYDGCKIKVVNA